MSKQNLFELEPLDPKFLKMAQNDFDSMESDFERLKLARTIHDHSGFWKLVDQFYNTKERKNWMPKSHAYERAESLHVVIFGMRLYKSFNSYRTYRAKLEK